MEEKQTSFSAFQMLLRAVWRNIWATAKKEKEIRDRRRAEKFPAHFDFSIHHIMKGNEMIDTKKFREIKDTFFRLESSNEKKKSNWMQ